MGEGGREGGGNGAEGDALVVFDGADVGSGWGCCLSLSLSIKASSYSREVIEKLWRGNNIPCILDS